MLPVGTEKRVVSVNLKTGLGVPCYTNMIRFNWIRRPVLCSPKIRRFASSYDADVAGLTEEEAEVKEFQLPLRYTLTSFI
jgi:hypothetical protein